MKYKDENGEWIDLQQLAEKQVIDDFIKFLNDPEADAPHWLDDWLETQKAWYFEMKYGEKAEKESNDQTP